MSNKFPSLKHRTAATTTENHKAEIAEVIEEGETGRRFCSARYVGLAACERGSKHDGEHRTTSETTGRIIGWDN